MCKGAFLRVVPAWLQKKKITYYCCDCADIADDLAQLLAGVDEAVIDEVRHSEKVAEATQYKLLNAAPPDPVQALKDDGVSATDDPSIIQLRRAHREAHEDKMDSWQDQVEQYILHYDGLKRGRRTAKKSKIKSARRGQ